MLAYEVAEEEPYLFPLSTYTGDVIHQAVSFLHKDQVDVKKVEFVKAWKLTSNSVEPMSFTVPRVKVRVQVLKVISSVIFTLYTR